MGRMGLIGRIGRIGPREPMAAQLGSAIGSGWLRSPSKDLVNRAVGQRDDEEVAIGAGVDVGADAEAGSKEQAFTFGDLELRQIVGYAVVEPGIRDLDLAAVAVALVISSSAILEAEAKQRSRSEERRVGKECRYWWW